MQLRAIPVAIDCWTETVRGVAIDAVRLSAEDLTGAE
jgi:hypothetical protein